MDRYGSDVLADEPRRPKVPVVTGEAGTVVECASTGWCGAIVGWESTPSGRGVILEDRHGRRRTFPLTPASFLLEGALITLARPASSAPAGKARTASGSVAPEVRRAVVARESRLWVEGTQDAELVERVWGADLRHEGVVVEHLGGIDDLVSRLATFDPGPDRRVGVLVDHLVPGSKEQRIAETVHARFPGSVLVVGHPFVDVWQAVRPTSIGIERWPVIPKGTPWKEGVLASLGWQVDTGEGWRRILGNVASFADLEPELLGRVEELIDFVTVDPRL